MREATAGASPRETGFPLCIPWSEAGRPRMSSPARPVVPRIGRGTDREERDHHVRAMSRPVLMDGPDPTRPARTPITTRERGVRGHRIGHGRSVPMDPHRISGGDVHVASRSRVQPAMSRWQGQMRSVVRSGLRPWLWPPPARFAWDPCRVAEGTWVFASRSIGRLPYSVEQAGRSRPASSIETAPGRCPGAVFWVRWWAGTRSPCLRRRGRGRHRRHRSSPSPACP